MISYKYKLYTTKHTKFLDNMLREACFVWNHALALQKRYYRIYKQYIPIGKMRKHFSTRIKRTYLHSQSTQEILLRLDYAYLRFFKRISKRPPKFKRHCEFSSFVYTQSGFSLEGNKFRIKSLKRNFKFSFSRPYKGKVKRVILKRSHLNEYYIIIVTDNQASSYTKTHNGASVGIDFGLKDYLTLSNGETIKNPQFLKKNLNTIRRLSRKLTKSKQGTKYGNNQKHTLNKLYELLNNSSRDFQWKLAHYLCRKFDTIYLEDLNLIGMSKLWGRKIHDLAHGRFVTILEQVAKKYGVDVHKIDKWFPSSKLCTCGYKNKNLKLYNREWVCPVCKQKHNRDLHASEMILRRGIYELVNDNKTIEPLGFYGCHT